MKKQFLLGLMAMLLPLTSWAAEGDPVLNQFVVSLTEDLENVTAVDYSGSVNVGVKVTYSYKTPEKIETSVLVENTHFTVSYDYTSFGGETKTGLTAAEVKDAGTYTVNVKGKEGSVYADESGTATFTVNRVPLTLTDQIVKEGARIQYGTTEEELKSLNIADYITLTTAENGLKQAGDLEDALKCLSLTYATRADEEGAKGAALLKVIKNKKNASTNYMYEGDGVYVKVDIDKKVLTLSLNETTRVYDGTTTTAESLVKGLDFVEKDDVQATYTVTKTNSDETVIKNVGTYTIKVDLIGDDKDNYEFSGSTSLNYEITRKVINIKTNDGAELSKVYDGKVVSTDDVAKFYTIDSAVDGDNITVTMQPSGATKTVVDAGERVVTIAPYVNGHQIQSKNWSAPETDWDAPEALSNYEIKVDGKSTASALPKFTITKRPVLFYFAGGKKVYQTTAVTNTTLKDYYKVEMLEAENTGFVTHESTGEGVEPTTDAFNQAPVAKFAGDVTEAKAIKTYDLTWDKTTEVTYSPDKENYEAIFVDAENEDYGNLLEGIENANVFEITKRELIIKALDKEIAYGDALSTLDEYLTINADKVQVEGTPKEGANIERGKVAQAADFTPILNKLGEALVIADDVDLSTVGTKEGVIKFSVNESIFAENEIYDIKLVAGNLIVKGAGEIVLDGGDEPEDAIVDLLKAYDGVAVEKVTIKGLRNFVNMETGKLGENTYIKADTWYTMVLPFNVTVRELSEAFGYAVVNVPNTTPSADGAAYFKLTVGEVPANTLLAFKVDEDMKWDAEKTVEFGGEKYGPKTIVNVTEDYEWANDGTNHFIGVYENKILTEETEMFLFAATGKFNTGAAVKRGNGIGYELYPLNGYVKVGSATARIFMEEADGSTTAIDAITGEVINDNAEGWYTVGGVKLNVQPTQKGVYINNGKKVVIK